MLKSAHIFFLRSNLEAFIWIAALFMLAFSDPATPHFSICPLKNIGWDFCPGCGLGHSISWLFRLDVARSFECHPLGMVAVVVLGYRIYRVFDNTNSKMKIIFKT